MNILLGSYGQSNEFLYRPPVFPQIEPIWFTDQRIKIFLIMIKNSRSYSNFQFENLTPQGINKTRFKKNEYFFLEIYITFIHFNKEKKKIKK